MEPNRTEFCLRERLLDNWEVEEASTSKYPVRSTAPRIAHHHHHRVSWRRCHWRRWTYIFKRIVVVVLRSRCPEEIYSVEAPPTIPFPLLTAPRGEFTLEVDMRWILLMCRRRSRCRCSQPQRPVAFLKIFIHFSPRSLPSPSCPRSQIFKNAKKSEYSSRTSFSCLLFSDPTELSSRKRRLIISVIRRFIKQAIIMSAIAQSAISFGTGHRFLLRVVRRDYYISSLPRERDFLPFTMEYFCFFFLVVQITLPTQKLTNTCSFYLSRIKNQLRRAVASSSATKRNAVAAKSFGFSRARRHLQVGI